MAKKKWKKRLKKLAKAALIGGALYAGTKALGKRKLAKAVSGTDDAGIGVKHFPSYITKKTKPKKWDIPHDKVFGDVSKGDLELVFLKVAEQVKKVVAEQVNNSVVD